MAAKKRKKRRKVKPGSAKLLKDRALLKKFTFSKPQLALFGIVFAIIGGYILIRSFAAAPAGSPVGVVFIYPNGSDTDVNCKNFGTPPASYPVTGCASLQKANQLLGCGQIAEMMDGTYGAQANLASTSRSCGSQTNNAVIQPAPAAAIHFTPGIALSAGGVNWLTINGQGRFDAGNAGSWAGKPSWPVTSVTFSVAGSNFTLKGVHFPRISIVGGDNNIVQDSEIGPCITPSSQEVSNYFAKSGQTTGCTTQFITTTNSSYIHNVIHDELCLSPSDSPDGVDWCNPPSSGTYAGTCPVAPSPCTFYSNGFHVDGMFLRGCGNCTFTRNFMYHDGVTDIRLQDCCGVVQSSNITITNNLFAKSTQNAAATIFRSDPLDFDTPMKNIYFGFNSFIDDCGDGTCPYEAINADSTAPATVTGNLMGSASSGSGCGSSVTWTYNVIMPFADGNVSSCGSATNTVLPFPASGTLKYTLSSEGGSWDAHLKTGAPGLNKVPANLCPAVDYYGNARPQAAGQFCDAGAVQTSGFAPPPSDTTPPTVSVTAPASGATVSGSSVTLSANASDNVAVAGVQFKLDGSNVGSEDTTSPYSISWDSTTAANGSHTISAVARDTSGNVTTSSAVSVTASNVVSGPPAITSFSPTSGPIGTVVTINGTNLDKTTTLQFNQGGVVTYTINSPTKITATVPTGTQTGNFSINFGVATSPQPFTVTATKTGDLNNDGAVNVSDLSILLSNYGTTNAVADINKDNIVNILDLSILLSNYGM